MNPAQRKVLRIAPNSLRDSQECVRHLGRSLRTEIAKRKSSLRVEILAQTLSTAEIDVYYQKAAGTVAAIESKYSLIVHYI